MSDFRVKFLQRVGFQSENLTTRQILHEMEKLKRQNWKLFLFFKRQVFTQFTP